MTSKEIRADQKQEMGLDDIETCPNCGAELDDFGCPACDPWTEDEWGDDPWNYSI